MPQHLELRELLPAEHIRVPLDAETVHDAVRQLVEHLAAQGAVRDPAALQRLLASTPLRDVVAVGRHAVLPHYRTDAVDRLVLALGIPPRPLQGADLEPGAEPRIVFLILAPPGAATRYLQTVAALTRALAREDVVRALLDARTPADVLAIPELGTLKIQPRLVVRDVMRHRVETVTPDTPADVLAIPELGTLKIQPRLVVRDVMRHRVETVTPDTPARDAVDLMVRHRLRALPVVGEKGEVLGVLAERDVVRALLPHIPRAADQAAGGEIRVPPTLKVRDIMTRSVLCIPEEMGVDEAASMMIHKDVEQVPVVGAGRLTGMLTRSDIIRKLFAR